MAVPETLQKLVDDGVIDDIKTRLMSGKEATVYVVERHGELLAAKVYKEREQRTFKATSSYTEGRNQTRNSRDKRAMGKRTAYGKELIEESWRDMEYKALTDAFHAGVRVPEPIMLYEDVLLMQLLVDETGAPAPRLADFELPADVAELLHREIYGQVRLLLASGKIHGDLSAFNVLIAEGGPTIIDLPQVVDAAGNNQAETILRRDLRNVTEHLARFDARLLRFRECGGPLWNHYQRGTLENAFDPEEGATQKEGQRGKRARDADRGRMGRGAGRGERGPPRVDDRGPPPLQQRDGRPADGRPAGARPTESRGPQRPAQQRDGRGPPPHDARDARGPPPGPRREDRGPPPGPRREDRGPPPPQRHDARDERGPPQRDDRGPPPRRDERGPPPRSDDRGAPPRTDDARNNRAPPPRSDGRGPPRRDDARDERGPPPRRDDARDERGPPPSRPHDDRGPARPPRRQDRPTPVVERRPPTVERKPAGAAPSAADGPRGPRGPTRPR